MLTQEQVRVWLHYDPETGVFRWKPSYKIAGSIDTHGKPRIMVDYKTYRQSRLAWLYVYGQWPELEIDHIDRDVTNNRIANLRLATRSQNQANTSVSSRSKSGFKGVYFNKNLNYWWYQITKDGKHEYGGPFDSAKQAADARAIHAQMLFGDFAYAG